MPTLTQPRKQSTTDNFSDAASQPDIEKAQEALEANGFNVLVVDNLDQLKQTVLDIIPEGSEVFTATSKTLEAVGLDKELNSDKYVSVRDKFAPLYGQPDKAVEMKRIGSGAEYAIGSVHALTQKEGYAVVASASGSQIPNYVYGASHVIWTVGSQKVVKDLNEAFERIETHTFPLEDKRALAAYGSHSSINKLLIYRKEPQGRVTIIIVKEPVGF